MSWKMGREPEPHSPSFAAEQVCFPMDSYMVRTAPTERRARSAAPLSENTPCPRDAKLLSRTTLRIIDRKKLSFTDTTMAVPPWQALVESGFRHCILFKVKAVRPTTSLAGRVLSK